MLLGHRVVQVACGSRDAQTLALTDEGRYLHIHLFFYVVHFLFSFLLCVCVRVFFFNVCAL